jgi:hypothetical protein
MRHQWSVWTQFFWKGGKSPILVVVIGSKTDGKDIIIMRHCTTKLLPKKDH